MSLYSSPLAYQQLREPSRLEAVVCFLELLLEVWYLDHVVSALSVRFSVGEYMTISLLPRSSIVISALLTPSFCAAFTI